MNATEAAAPHTNPTYTATVAQLRIAIEHAPASPGPIAADLLGWWTADGVYICSTCAGRIIARGCQLPRGVEAVWAGQPYGTCCTCGK
jgi:hypothetical protein